MKTRATLALLVCHTAFLMAQGPAPRTKVNEKDGQTYVWIAPGSFTMGCSEGDSECFPNETPPHPAKVDNGFWLSRTLVTQSAWTKAMGGNPSKDKGDQLPVEQVTWNDAVNYCSAIGGRLPTEVEYEYAARGGVRWSRYGNLEEIAWYQGNAGNTTHPVAGKQANAFGLFDMLGNVWEWTADDSPVSPGQKTIRGGSILNGARYVRSSHRASHLPGNGGPAVGLRCVMSGAKGGDAEAWQTVRDSTSGPQIEEFLRDYPDSPYAGAARLKLAMLATIPLSLPPVISRPEAPGSIYKVGGDVTGPKALHRVDPEYSNEARKAKYSGTVLLSVVIDPKGRATDIHVVKALGMGLDEKAIEAVKKWKFAPGTKNGVPVNVRAQIEINFRLL